MKVKKKKNKKNKKEKKEKSRKWLLIINLSLDQIRFYQDAVYDLFHPFINKFFHYI